MVLGIKKLVVKQLPNMAQKCVSQLVLDPEHESLALLTRKTKNNFLVMGNVVIVLSRGRNLAKLDFCLFLKLNMYVDMARD